MEAAHAANVEKFIFLGSSCIYPRDCAQPIKEEYLLTGPLEETNSAYAVAKIAGIELIKSFRKEYGRKWISLMPTNLYGPFDNFELQGSHVLPAFIRRFVEATETGAAKERTGAGDACGVHVKVWPEAGFTSGFAVFRYMVELLALPVTAFAHVHVLGEPSTLMVRLFTSVAQLAAVVPVVLKPTCGELVLVPAVIVP